MVHDDETRNADRPPNPPDRPSYWAEKEQRLAAASGGTGQRSPWSVALPVAVVIMVALIAFLIVWMLLHHGKNASTSGASTGAPSVAQNRQAAPSTSTGISSQSSAHSGGTPSGSASSAEPSTSTSTVTSTVAPNETSADFPSNVIDACADYLGSDDGYQSKNPKIVSIGDSGVRVDHNHGRNSCDFIHDAAHSIRSAISDGSNTQSFDVRVHSGWRAANGYKGSDTDIDLSCTTANDLAHCVSTKGKVDMYVKP